MEEIERGCVKCRNKKGVGNEHAVELRKEVWLNLHVMTSDQ